MTTAEKEKHFEKMLVEFPHVVLCDMESTDIFTDLFYTTPGAADAMGMTITPFNEWGIRVYQFRERRELRQVLKVLKRFDPLAEELKPGVFWTVSFGARDLEGVEGVYICERKAA